MSDAGRLNKIASMGKADLRQEALRHALDAIEHVDEFVADKAVLEKAIEQTDYSAGIRFDRIVGIIRELDRTTEYDRKELMEAVTQIIRGKAFAGEQLEQAIKLLPDMARGSNTDLMTVAKDLVTAGKEPGQVENALAKYKITLSGKQAGELKGKVTSGNVFGYQDDVLKLFAERYAGTAELSLGYIDKGINWVENFFKKDLAELALSFDTSVVNGDIDDVINYYEKRIAGTKGLLKHNTFSKSDTAKYNKSIEEWERKLTILKALKQDDRKMEEEAYAIVHTEVMNEVRREDTHNVQPSVSSTQHSQANQATQNTASASCSCPFAGKNIEDICFTCKCDCSEKKETLEGQPQDNGGGYQNQNDSKPLPQTQLVSNSRGQGLAGSVPTFLPAEGQNQLPFMGLTDLFTGEIETWTNKFDFLNTSVSKMFSGWQKDLLSVFNQGNFSIETFANKLLNLSANNPLQGFFSQLQGYMSSLSSMSFGGGGGGGFWGGLMNIASSAIGAYFGYSAPASTDGGGAGGSGGTTYDGGYQYNMPTQQPPPVYQACHVGGFVGVPTQVAYGPASLFANAPKFHSGGWLGPGERPIIAKEGELILNEAQQKRVAGRMNGGVNVTVPVIVENHSKEKVQSQEETGPDGKKQIRMLIGDAVKKGIASGQFDQSMNRAYGLSRKGY